MLQLICPGARQSKRDAAEYIHMYRYTRRIIDSERLYTCLERDGKGYNSECRLLSTSRSCIPRRFARLPIYSGTQRLSFLSLSLSFGRPRSPAKRTDRIVCAYTCAQSSKQQAPRASPVDSAPILRSPLYTIVLCLRPLRL